MEEKQASNHLFKSKYSPRKWFLIHSVEIVYVSHTPLEHYTFRSTFPTVTILALSKMCLLLGMSVT